MNSKNFKFILFNTLFFGIVCPSIGATIISVIWIFLSLSFQDIGSFFLFGTLFGFIPASLTGYLYSITCLIKKRSGLIIAAAYGALVMGTLGLLLNLSSPKYIYDIDYKQHLDVFGYIESIFLFSLFGASVALVCAKIIKIINIYTK